jgi:ribosomal protein S19
MRVRKVSEDGSVTELARMWGRRSFAAASVVAAVIAVIVGAKYLRFLRKYFGR